jgi:glycosyltransferase involved in cell wall biosynthesis
VRPTRDIVCVSTADWDASLWTNKQHLMSRLADAGWNVVYIDSLGLRRPGASAQDASRIVNRLRAWRPFATTVRPGIRRDSPLVIPMHGNRSVQRLNRQLLRWRLRRNERRWRLRQPVVWTYAPAGADLFDPRRHAGLIYHCVDDLAAYPGVDAAAFSIAERRLVREADVCVVSSRVLERKLRELGPRRLEYWPNPADTDTMREALALRRPNEEPVVVGFIGAVQDHKVDIALVEECARLRPDWVFELVGPVDLGLGGSSLDTSHLPDNVRLSGAVAHHELPAVLGRFRLAMIPYRINEYTASVFPMKVFEYLAAGLPVVATPLPSLVGEVEHVLFAEDAAGFVAALDEALQPDVEAVAAARAAYAGSFSWEARARQATALLDEVTLPVRPAGPS